MKKNILFLLLLLPFTSYSQGNDVFMVVEQMDEFPGGQRALDSVIHSYFIMPDTAFERGVAGKIYVEFIVDTSGKVKDIKILRDGVGYGCGEEALRVMTYIAENFTWQPAEQRNKKVAVRKRLPIIINTKDFDPVTKKSNKYH